MRLEELRTIPSSIRNIKAADRRHKSLIQFAISAGYKPLHKPGAYGTVLQKPGDSYVLKIFKKDVCYLKFINLVIQHQHNRHFPKITRKILRIPGDAVNFGIRIEPLVPITEKDWIANYPMHCWLVQLSDSYFSKILLQWSYDILVDRDDDQIIGAAEEFEEDQPELAATLRLILRLTGSGCRFDLHQANFMKRLDGTWVVTDPVVTEDIYYDPLANRKSLIPDDDVS